MTVSKDLNKKVGEYIEKRRKGRGIKQKTLAKSVGISEVYYRQIIRGNYRPNWVIFVTICLALKIDVNYILEKFVEPELNRAVKREVNTNDK